MKILITGIFGQIGWNLAHAARNQGHTVVGTYHNQRVESTFPVYPLEMMPHKLEHGLRLLPFLPDVILHCAAYTNVDKAESERPKVFAINSLSSNPVVSYARSIGAKLIYLSTDYVFDGLTGGYTESSIPFPRGVYGLSKLLGEAPVLAYKNGFVIRFTPLGHALRLPHHPLSLMDWILKCYRDGKKAPLFFNRTSSPVTAMDLWNVIDEILAGRQTQALLHVHSDLKDLLQIGREIEKVFLLSHTTTYGFLSHNNYSKIRPFLAHLKSNYLKPVSLNESLITLKQQRKSHEA
ncbi:MAG: sugar nucleotide-binding protein [Candidatus Cloacimonetes bacterium]|nr:sugar nucleotide-binding protein [Candidatus Cloacimonadota bacterium]